MGRTRTLLELYDQIMVAVYGGRIKKAYGINNKKKNRKTKDTNVEDPGFQPSNAANLFRHCLVSNVNERLRLDPLLGTCVVNPDVDATRLNLETEEQLLDLWTEVLTCDDLSERAAELKQIAIDCNAFPDRRLFEKQLQHLPEVEEEVGSSGEDDEGPEAEEEDDEGDES